MLFKTWHKCKGFMLYSSLFDGRQQHVRRPSNNGCDDRQQRC